jgi:DNA-binding NarL/FixJ family response regulator
MLGVALLGSTGLRDTETITVLVGGLDPLVARGVLGALRTDRRIRASVCRSAGPGFEDEISRQGPRVVVVGERVAYRQLIRIGAIGGLPALLVVAEHGTELLGPLLLGIGVSRLAPGATRRDLLKTVHLAASGQPTFRPHQPVDRPERSYPSDVAHLTERERDVLGFLSEGQTNREIAAALQISIGTVRTHVARILQKLDRQSRRDFIGMTTNGHR